MRDKRSNSKCAAMLPQRKVSRSHSVSSPSPDLVATRHRFLSTYQKGRSAVGTDGALLSSSPLDFSADIEEIVFEGLPAVKVQRLADEWTTVESSEHAKMTINPIRKIVDVMSVTPNPDKELIKLHLGDPTLTGTLPTHPTVLQALTNSVMSGKYNGYGPATGIPTVREAVAQHVTSSEARVSSDDVILTSGCSHALQMAIEVLGNPGDNILVPRPGFPLYTTLMRPHGIEDRHYNLMVDQNWEVDLNHLEDLIDHRTKAIIVNNPSNPCGAVYSKEHLQAILEIADKYKVPIIADEIYGDLTFAQGCDFYPMATLEPKVPILTCDGIGKRYLVPGWRLGWLIVHNRNGAFNKVHDGLRQLATKIVGPCAVVQGALPSILQDTPKEFFDRTRQILGTNARAAAEELEAAPGLNTVPPQGAMYVMVGIDMALFPHFENELDFTKALISEESVYCLPGSAFFYPDSFRLVLAYSESTTREACRRIREFCQRHYQLPAKSASVAVQIKRLMRRES